jgi:hypothetical protein
MTIGIVTVWFLVKWFSRPCADIAKRDLRCIKYEMKKLKSREVSEVGLCVDASVLQELRGEVAAAKSVADKAKDAASKPVPPVVPIGVSLSEGIDSDWMQKDLRYIQYEIKKLQRKTKETIVSVVPEVVSPVEQDADLSPESEDRIDPSVISELREEIGAAKASVDAANAAASDAKSAVALDVPGVVDSESMKKDLRCIEYEMKKPKAKAKSINVSASAPSVDKSVAQEL